MHRRSKIRGISGTSVVRAAGAAALLLGASAFAGCSSVGISAGGGGIGVSAARSLEAPDHIVSGTVTYLQRIALPPSSTVRVQVLDVSKADAIADILGTIETTTGGKQPPYPFEIRIPRSFVKDDATIVVRARIEDPTGLRFISDEPTPVITKGAPTQVELVLAQVQRPGGE